ncbi:MAG: Uma2 family endonuclease [Parafilimonas sp.]
MEVNEPAVKYHPKMTAEAYLEWERKQPYKHEYVEGEIADMAGASAKHNKILTNIIRKEGTFLEGKSCEIYPSDLRIFVKSKESYFYPDATIICGELEFADNVNETVTNPSVIFEILSPSTQDYDIGRKLFFYMQIESLKEYIIIDSASRNIRIGRKKENNSWQFQELTNENDIISITAIQ